MKKLITFAAFLAFMGLAKISHAGDFTASISTYPINEAATMAAQVSGEQDIDKLIISNSTTTTQTVTVYKLCDSTTTVTAVMTLILPANQAPVVLDFMENYNNPLTIDDVCFRKSDSAALVYISAHYR
jgi:hypothetical protein